MKKTHKKTAQPKKKADWGELKKKVIEQHKKGQEVAITQKVYAYIPTDSPSIPNHEP